MLEPDESSFPNNVVKFIALAEKRIDPEISVFKRPLRNSDPQQSIGVSASSWVPDPGSMEMQGPTVLGGQGGPAPQVPTLQSYTLNVQAFVKDSDQERGLAVHSYMSQRVRSVLYTDNDLQLILAGLSASLPGGWTESTRRWGVRTARYFSGEIQAQMLYLSTLEFWVETETRRTN